MRIRGSIAKGLLTALAISLIPVAAISAQKVTAGSKCKVFKQKVPYLDKTYTCIKSGKKLVWSKGVVAVKPTPTPTVTPSITPTTVYQYNLRTGGWYQNVCQSVSMIANPANVNIFTGKPFELLELGDYVYGDQNLSIPPVGANFTISNGSRFIQLSGNLIINVGVC